MIFPDRATFNRYARRGLRVPVALTRPTAWTPQEAFERLGGPARQPACLLESGRTHAVTGRSSFIGLDAASVITPSPAADDPAAVLRRLSRARRLAPLPGAPLFPSGLIGWLSYEARRSVERLPARPAVGGASARRDLALPEFCFVAVETVVTIDHERGLTTIATCPASDAPYDAAVARVERWAAQLRQAAAEMPEEDRADGLATFEASATPAHFERMVRRAKQYIREGEIYQANLSLRLSCARPRDTWRLYRRLQAVNPSPFAAYLAVGDVTVISSSPERLLCSDGRTVQTRPIAGTRPRSRIPEEDFARAMELVLSDKERAEHLMLVDLARNDLGRVCAYGSVQVDELMTLEEYSHVLHIVSNIRGALRPGCGAWAVLAALFPGGTVTGTPKIRCMELIDELEPVARELYTGSIGYLSDTGAMDWNIAIRTIYAVGDRLAIHAGSGIVADSDPAAEYVETMAKAQAMIEAVHDRPAVYA